MGMFPNKYFELVEKKGKHGAKLLARDGRKEDAGKILIPIIYDELIIPNIEEEYLLDKKIFGVKKVKGKELYDEYRPTYTQAVPGNYDYFGMILVAKNLTVLPEIAMQRKLKTP